MVSRSRSAMLIPSCTQRSKKSGMLYSPSPYHRCSGWNRCGSVRSCRCYDPDGVYSAHLPTWQDASTQVAKNWCRHTSISLVALWFAWAWQSTPDTKLHRRRKKLKSLNNENTRPHRNKQGFFELQEFILFPSQTIYFHHKPNSDFQSFFKSGLLPCTAHRSLPVHDLLPERNLISDKVIYEPIHSFQSAQPLF